jgi:Tat protein secretion system quality control protein TatD with DNase activity|tara:strand:- start:827 stop:1150 length:324 start_codon:yes stop_codon:yes gene_type:complete
MNNFFDSDVVRKELQSMQDLYLEINKMGLMLSVEDKKEQLQKMMRLIDLQQTMFMRVTLSDDPQAKQLVSQVKNAASMVGMSPNDINPQFYDGLRDNVQKMIDQLPT